MPRRDKQKLGLLIRREDIGVSEIAAAIRTARQRVAMIVHAAARERRLVVSGRNREALYAKIGQVYLQLDNGLKDWGKDLVKNTLIDWRDEAIKDITGQTGINPSNEITKFSREYAENTFKLIHPDNAKSLAGVFTEKMAAGDIGQLRQAAVDTFRERALAGRTMTEMAGDLQAKWDGVAGNMATNRFIDAAGREWDNGRYLQMLVRTTVARTSREGYFNTLTENGDDLVIIMNVDGEACEICQAWDGVIVSITGASKDYPAYSQAIAAGLFHPNCRCSAERVDETIDAAAIQQQANSDTPDFKQARGESNADYRDRVTEAMAKYSKDFDIDLGNSKDNNIVDRGMAHENKILSIDPSDWETPRDYTAARRVAKIAERDFRDIQSGFYPQVNDTNAPTAFGAEIAAVIGGRKPLYHEYYPGTAPILAASLKRELPNTVKVDHIDSTHLIVYDPIQVRKIMDSDPGFYRPHRETDLEAIKSVVKKSAMGELLGYGARTMDMEKDSVIVHIIAGDTVIAGFITREVNAELFAAARALDYQQYIGAKTAITVVIKKPR